MAALLGRAHYDRREREEPEAAREAAYFWARQAGHGEIMGWAYETRPWLAIAEVRREKLSGFARAGPCEPHTR
jgi:hypothetical protein